MRTANVVVSVLGVAGILVAAAMVWRWRHLPLRSARLDLSNRRVTAADATRSLGAVLSAGVVAGLLVLGLGGRLVMRLLAATSAEAQGRLTEAGERVGEITLGGTLGFMVFVGLGGGLVTALAYLFLRRWLPRTAWPAGLVGGVILVGTLGVLDPFAPDNVDFVLLRPTWLAIVSVLATGMLFAGAFTALAARLDAVAAGTSWRAWLPCVSLTFALIPTFALFCVAYVGGRVLARGRVGRVLDQPVPATLGRALVGLSAALTLAVAVAAAAEIATA